MANTYTWDVSMLVCRPEVNAMANYVVYVGWTLNGTDGDWTTNHNAGYVEFEVNQDKPNYTPFADLTKEQVIGWVKDSPGPEKVASYEALVDAEIANKSNPLIVIPNFPWNKQ